MEDIYASVLLFFFVIHEIYGVLEDTNLILLRVNTANARLKEVTFPGWFAWINQHFSK